jgi:VWFA-related protein
MSTRSSPSPPYAEVVLTLAAAIAGSLAWTFVSAAPARAQAPQPRRAFSEVIEVRVVEVAVVVTDAHGERVTGLGRDDFRLWVDDREVPIDYFDEHRDGMRVQPAPGAMVDVGAQPAPTPADGVDYLVFLDDFFTDRRYRAAVLKRAGAELDALRPRDRMAVVRFRGRGVETLTDWTASKTELARVLAEARAAPTWELRRDARLSVATNPANHVEVIAGQIQKAQEALAAAMRAFAGVSGRKVLLLLSSGWPYELGHSDDLAARLEANRLGGPRLLRPVIDTANLLGFTIYTFHLGSLGRNPTAEDRTPTPLRPESWELLGSLGQFAAETGGRAFAYATAIPRPFTEVAEDTANYYSLGFRASMLGDGGQRSIDVQVLREGLRVRHRSGYRDLARAERSDLAAEAALLAKGPAGPPLDVTLGEPHGGIRRLELPYTLRIPMDWVTMIPGRNGAFSARLELRVAALDGAGDRSELSTIPVALTGPRPAPGSHSVYEAALKLRRRKQRLVFTLTDPLTGESLTSTVEFHP